MIFHSFTWSSMNLTFIPKTTATCQLLQNFFKDRLFPSMVLYRTLLEHFNRNPTTVHERSLVRLVTSISDKVSIYFSGRQQPLIIKFFVFRDSNHFSLYFRIGVIIAELLGRPALAYFKVWMRSSKFLLKLHWIAILQKLGNLTSFFNDVDFSDCVFFHEMFG